MPTLFIPRERVHSETRVAATPETVRHFVEDGAEVLVETGAGRGASFTDEAYTEAGARIAEAPPSEPVDAMLVVQAPSTDEPIWEAVGEGTVVLGFVDPFQRDDLLELVRERRATLVSIELVPRITRAQSMDALSSQASIAGYKAVLLAASRLDRYFPLLMTAAGTIKPSRVVVMGGGVAGLQALATARRLGAVVEVSDIRPEVEEQVESLGGRFIELPELETGAGEGGYAKQMDEEFLRRQREIVKKHVAAADVVLCTAQVPGKKAPILVTREMVEAMRAGAVIVDIAAPQGGNCELTELEQEVDAGGVTVLGPLNLPASMPRDASVLYARNVEALLGEALGEDGLEVDLDNDVLQGCVVLLDGRAVHPKLTHLEAEVTG